ncbi:hypothetical protein HDU98_000577, partial [Podochytrium sp. JEL0797]
DALLGLAEAMSQNRELLAYSEAIVGKTIGDSRLDVDASVECFRFFSGQADKAHSRSFSLHPTQRSFTIREPVGVCGLITSFNYPLLLAAWKLAPCLASGNTVLLKPSHQTPFSSLLLASLSKPFLPPGVLNVLLGDATTGSHITSNTSISKISFTGSTSAGAKVASQLALSTRKATLELGGKNAIIVHKDAQLSRAVSFAVDAAFGNAGQNCCAGSRVIVHREVHDEFVGLVKERVRGLKVGDAREEGTGVGPVVDEVAMWRVLGFVERAKSTAARLECGGGRVQRGGYFVEPTVLSGVEDASELAQEEVFGPVLSVLKPYDTIEEAVERVNGCKYGLAAGIFTDSIRTANQAVKKLKAGFVWVNNYNEVPAYLPLGGFKSSGYGKECGLEAMDEIPRSPTAPRPNTRKRVKLEAKLSPTSKVSAFESTAKLESTVSSESAIGTPTKPESPAGTEIKLNPESPTATNLPLNHNLNPEPKHFAQVLSRLREYRAINKAPVDTVGCGWLANRDEPPHIFRFQTLTALLLSSQTKDERNAAAIARLKSLPGGLTIDSILETKTEDLEEILLGVSFHKRKAVYLKKTAEMLVESYNSDVPNTIEELLNLPGIGPKMGYLALQCCWNVSTGIGVDTHVHRISNRLGWVHTKKTDPEATRKELEG